MAVPHWRPLVAVPPDCLAIGKLRCPRFEQPGARAAILLQCAIQCDERLHEPARCRANAGDALGDGTGVSLRCPIGGTGWRSRINHYSIVVFNAAMPIGVFDLPAS
jgi:hypothetical protein